MDKARPRKSSRVWNPNKPSMEVRSSYCFKQEEEKEEEVDDGGADPWGPSSSRTASKVDVDMALSRIGRGTLYAQIMAPCCMTTSFWSTLKDFKYIKMLACVCKGSRALLEPKGPSLPFWGVWVECIPPQLLTNFQSFMNVKNSDLKELVEVSERVYDWKMNSPRLYSLKGVLEYMKNKYGGMDKYAGAITKFRANRLLYFRRRVTFQQNNGGIKDTVEGEKPPRRPKGWRLKAEAEQAEAKKNQMKDVKDAFSTALCASVEGLKESSFHEKGTPGVFMLGYGEDDTILMKRWNMMLRMFEICVDFFPPSKFHSVQSCKSMRMVSAMHFCLHRHMPTILKIVNDTEAHMPNRLALIKEEALKLSRTIYIWMDATRSMKRLVASLSTIGNLDIAQINTVAFSDTASYFPLMEIETRKREKGIGASIPWGASGIVSEGGIFHLLGIMSTMHRFKNISDVDLHPPPPIVEDRMSMGDNGESLLPSEEEMMFLVDVDM